MKVALGALAAAAVLGAGALVFTSCSSSAPTASELVVAVTSDVAFPKDLDHVHVQVLSNGKTYYDSVVAVGGPGNTAFLPAVLHVTTEDPAQAVTVRVYARQQRTMKVLREVITTVPGTRRALLRVPLQFLSFGSAQLVGTSPSAVVADAVDQQQVATTCSDPSKTNVAGTCADVRVTASTLPDYHPEDVFGGGGESGGGRCFDTTACFATSVARAVDTSDCSLDASDVPSDRVNVALETGAPPDAAGICDETRCLVPLDFASSTGFTFTSGTGRIGLPRGVCDALAAGRIAAVRVSAACEIKLQRYPACGAWSLVGAADAGGNAIEPDGGAIDAGGDGGDAEPDDGGGDGSPGDAAPDVDASDGAAD